MRLILGLLLLVSLFLIGCGQTVPSEMYCETAQDCVAATCCHPTDAVNSAYGPDCTATICTASCEPETLDCGQGHIACVQNTCTVILN